MGTNPAQSQIRLSGFPECLHPAPAEAGRRRFEVATDGPRNLSARPFDYRNPCSAEASSFEGEVSPAFFHYYANAVSALGLPGGPECALVDSLGTLLGHTGGWAFALGEEGTAPALVAGEAGEVTVPDIRFSARHEAGAVCIRLFRGGCPGSARMPVSHCRSRALALGGRTAPERSQSVCLHSGGNNPWRRIRHPGGAPFGLCPGAGSAGWRRRPGIRLPLSRMG